MRQNNGALMYLQQIKTVSMRQASSFSGRNKENTDHFKTPSFSVFAWETQLVSRRQVSFNLHQCRSLNGRYYVLH